MNNGRLVWNHSTHIPGLIAAFLAYRGFEVLKAEGLNFITSAEWSITLDESANVVESNFGLSAMLVGTILCAIVAVVIAVPISVLSALYLNFYAPAWLKKILVAVIDMMAAFPSILFGIWGFLVLMPSVEYLKLGEDATTAVVVATVFTVIVGCVSFSGSIITFLKLQELMTTRPVIFPFGRQIIALTLIGVLASGVWVITSGGTTPLLVNGVLSLFFGVLFVLPVGGADVPIVISLLNAFTGLTVAASGYVLQTTVLIVAGTLVGASGTILTRLMAEAMGRSLFGTLFGAFTAKATAQTGQVDAGY